MLYKHGVDTVRVHSSFVDEVEIEKLTYSLAQFETGFDDDVIEFLENGGEKEKDPYSFGSHLPVLKEDAGDELFDQAVEIVTECRSASASMLQRRLKIGYNRAANLVELMEEKGIVGPAQGSKPRKVLIAFKIVHKFFTHHVYYVNLTKTKLLENSSILLAVYLGSLN